MSPAKKTARKTTKKKAAARKKAAPKKGASKKKASPRKKTASRKKATGKKASSRKASPKQSTSTKSAPKAKKSAAKKATSRKATAKPAEKKAAPKKAAAPEAAPVAKTGAKKKKTAKRRKAKPTIAPEIIKPGLGGKWECFSCGAKFYDLGKPEPICPKCGADQRDRPRDRQAASNVTPTRRPAVAPMAPAAVIDEDDEPVQDFEPGDDEIEALDEKGFLNSDGSSDDDDTNVDVRVIDDD